MIKIRHKGDFSKTERFLKRSSKEIIMETLEKYGQQGVNALMSTTPRDTGKTARSWYYKINFKNERISIDYCNSNINEGVPIAVIIQYGHGTGTGGYVEGIDYINPALRPIFENIANDAWKEVTKS